MRPTILLLACTLISCDRSEPSPVPEDATDAATAQQIDPCSLLEASEISVVMEIEPGEPRLEPPHCIWSSADGSEQHLVMVSVTPSHYQSWDEYIADMQEELGEYFDASEFERVDDIGRFGVVLDRVSVQVFTGTQVLQISSHEPGTAWSDRTTSLELARRALPRVN